MAGKELFAPDLLDHEIVSVALKKSAIGYAAARLLSGEQTSG